MIMRGNAKIKLKFSLRIRQPQAPTRGGSRARKPTLSGRTMIMRGNAKIKLKFSLRIRQPQAPTRGGSRARKPTLIDAFTYMHGVKETFRETPYKYQMFLDVVKDYVVRTDIAGVIARITDLFEGHSDLLIGFNAFLPESIKIDVPRI
ncbi:paired amphipathic helix protein Sin3-like 5 [Artemisia annua]|uniref:Paired amphipathic helix protein Sin3-like 5 n=1 Tax=Artemisia annua TaxID=35608 RepID=A0A2U1Q8W8_ARTAN|nr:paired amphipathic helix protein Sin3-like 5 [Artemisia annua]